MILATVGTQLPFPRLFKALDAWAASHTAPILAQIGQDDSHYANLRCHKFLDKERFQAALDAADIVVAHAGIGTILSAVELGKPVVVLPRRADLGEHRNDHQIATARRLEKLAFVHVAWETEDLAPLLARLIAGAGDARDGSQAEVSRNLLDAVGRFIRGEEI